MKTQKTTLAVMVASCFGTGVAMAEEAKVLSPVVVTATRTEQDSFDLPMAIDKVEKQNIQDGQLRMTLSESLARVPGITAQNRNQMAQDPQISSRGFGARSSFGVRGLRVYVDGIPLSMPDGIGNPGSVDLGSIAAIEVMRGPFSAMYGNSSGGVIQMLTDTPPATPEVSADVLLGSFNTRRASVQAAGTQKGVEYLINYSDYRSDGFRVQSQNDKQQATVKLGVKLAEDTKLTTLINWFDQFAQDPGGLVRTGNVVQSPGAFDGTYYDPKGATRGALVGNTRVMRSNTQVGFNLEKTIDANNTLNAIVYAGRRDNLQSLATSNAAAGDISGRASSIARDYYGADLRLTHRGNLMDKPYSLTAGVNAGYMTDDRLDRNANNGVIVPNVTPNRDENQKATNFDQYVQGIWSFDPRWDLHAGIRHTNLDLKIRPNLGAGVTTNPADLSFSKTLPVAGIVFKATPVLNFYANVGKGFETPTLIEITYADAASAAAGANTTLKPSSSTNLEAGAKWLASDYSRVNAAAFMISTENEIVVSKQVGTTASYNNAGKTQRSGVELSLEHRFNNKLSGYLAYTYLDATFDQTYTYTSSGSPVTVNKGNAIPGTYQTQLYGELAWKEQSIGLNSAVEMRHFSKAFVNDTNTDSAPAYTIFSVRASLQQQVGQWRISEYARIDNLFDKEYIGSVRVNDSNSRFFEPAPGRNYIVGVKANYAF